MQQLQHRISALGCLLVGTTLEHELTRRRHYQQLDQPLPPLPLPSQHLPYYRELQALIKVLGYEGSPQEARISVEKLSFYLGLVEDLEQRFCRFQEASEQQWREIGRILDNALFQHRRLGERYPMARHHRDFYRIFGAVNMLGKLHQEAGVDLDFLERESLAFSEEIKAFEQRCQDGLLDGVTSTK
jgi:hypothetical protein